MGSGAGFQLVEGGAESSLECDGGEGEGEGGLEEIERGCWRWGGGEGDDRQIIGMREIRSGCRVMRMIIEHVDSLR